MAAFFTSRTRTNHTAAMRSHFMPRSFVKIVSVLIESQRQGRVLMSPDPRRKQTEALKASIAFILADAWHAPTQSETHRQDLRKKLLRSVSRPHHTCVLPGSALVTLRSISLLAFR